MEMFPPYLKEAILIINVTCAYAGKKKKQFMCVSLSSNYDSDFYFGKHSATLNFP